MNDFWQSIDTALATIRSERPTTFDGVKAILDQHGDPDASGSHGPDASFFGGGGGDATLRSALEAAGWRCTWAEASYYYVLAAPSGELLTYIEGDVQRGDTARHACPVCDGTGVVRPDEEDAASEGPCESCSGSGRDAADGQPG